MTGTMVRPGRMRDTLAVPWPRVREAAVEEVAAAAVAVIPVMAPEEEAEGPAAAQAGPWSNFTLKIRSPSPVPSTCRGRLEGMGRRGRMALFTPPGPPALVVRAEKAGIPDAAGPARVESVEPGVADPPAGAGSGVQAGPAAAGACLSRRPSFQFPAR